MAIQRFYAPIGHGLVYFVMSCLTKVLSLSIHSQFSYPHFPNCKKHTHFCCLSQESVQEKNVDFPYTFVANNSVREITMGYFRYGNEIISCCTDWINYFMRLWYTKDDYI